MSLPDWKSLWAKMAEIVVRPLFWSALTALNAGLMTSDMWSERSSKWLAFLIGMNVTASIYCILIERLLSKNRKLIEVAEQQQEMLKELMKTKAHEIGAEIAEHLRGVANIEVHPKPTTKH